MTKLDYLETADVLQAIQARIDQEGWNASTQEALGTLEFTLRQCAEPPRVSFPAQAPSGLTGDAMRDKFLADLRQVMREKSMR